MRAPVTRRTASPVVLALLATVTTYRRTLGAAFAGYTIERESNGDRTFYVWEKAGRSLYGHVARAI